MDFINADKIINGTPKKRIVNGYNRLKENYTEEASKEFMSVYMQESYNDVLDNSELIFADSFHGLDFYNNIMESVATCPILSLDDQISATEDFYENHKNDMGEKQASLYKTLVESANEMKESCKNIKAVATLLEESGDHKMTDFSNIIYEYKNHDKEHAMEAFKSYYESCDMAEALFYGVLAYESLDDTSIIRDRFNHILNEVSEMTFESASDKEWGNYVKSVLFLNKAGADKLFRESVKNIPVADRTIVEAVMNANLSDDVMKAKEINVSEDDLFIYSTPETAVNALFESVDFDIDHIVSEHDSVLNKYRIALESSMELMKADMYSGDPENTLQGYTLFESTDDYRIEDGIVACNDALSIFSEESDDDELDDLEKEDENPSEKEPEKKVEANVAGKKPQAPKAKNLATKIQNKAMDLESKFLKKRAIQKQKGQEVKNAAKAVSAIPKDIINDAQKTVKKLDEMDDERRKNYMSEPGFRKKAFRNLKLAILYGSAAQVKLTMIPVVMLGRHFSKEKDRRMKNELVREIGTEIKICEEKINDANANGDTKEKYRLMRIKDQLDAELVRVKVNSKYV